MPFLHELVQIGVKAEATEGTYTAPGAAQMSLHVRNPTWRIINPKTQREIRQATFSKRAHRSAAVGGELTFEVDLYALTQTTKPAWVDPLLKACGYGTITGGGGVAAWVMNLLSENSLANVPPVSISHNVNGYLRKLAGARGSVSIVAKAGDPFVARFRFLGAHADPSDTAFTGGVSFDATCDDLPVFMGASVALTAVAPAANDLTTAEAILESFEFDLGNQLTLRPSANAAFGYLSCQITGRDPKVVIDPEWLSVSAFDAIEAMRKDYLYSMTTGLCAGHASKNNIKLDFPRLQFMGLQDQNKGGILAGQFEFGVRGNAGDDDATITLST